MSQIVTFLSGNVPGGIFLYILVVLVTFFVLYFMYRVNELFTKKHLVRWLISCLVFFTVVYGFIWFKNPPHSVYKRYSIGIIQSGTKENWLGFYLTDAISGSVKPYRSEREYFFPYRWLYKMSLSDSVSRVSFADRIYEKMPVQKVLEGKVERRSNSFLVHLELCEYPGRRVIAQAEDEFDLRDIDVLIEKIKRQFGGELPFKESIDISAFQSRDSLLALIKQSFYAQNYKKAAGLLQMHGSELQQDPEFNRWEQYLNIKEAAAQAEAAPVSNPYIKVTPHWQKEMRIARAELLDELRSGLQSRMADLMVAESYLWEEDFSAAEVFLKRAFIENPFDIDVLLNLSFLYPSRYREFGFKNMREIYRRILTVCPVDEAVLLKWSDLILKGNPAYTAAPDFAKDFVQRYLGINPYSVPVWIMLGKIQSLQLERSQALQAFLKADSLKPNNGLINYNIGILFYEWEKYDQAETYFKRSVADDNYLDSHLYLGAIYKEKGEYEKALNEFRYRVEHSQGEDDIYSYQAMKGIRECLEALGRPLQ